MYKVNDKSYELDTEMDLQLNVQLSKSHTINKNGAIENSIPVIAIIMHGYDSENDDASERVTTISVTEAKNLIVVLEDLISKA